ncbi:uncharacterized protein BO96DRAFT_352541 [Aspergillus niger CBS 101883]|uniref:Uncharacterized protein n=2 Tax=Aspergillus niger TaxID=5061 RepID=A2Q7F4_ASPNC|nr:uncharacterized protein BO96DRAFT_352541 [Aspergillus niger CBS 101883]XP_059603026.1 hypothetical protein An01g00500 [Aspergillus niger]PYH50457.1 hypothetical protein BO96DRAFT_352541 [Aspergillus niger CBS 101883]CAK43438.1 hypothetical protein An01g00500 [Aspergillus niger]
MDRSATSRNTGSSGHAANGAHSDLPDLATYQAQWAKIHDDTVRQINEALAIPFKLAINDEYPEKLAISGVYRNSVDSDFLFGICLLFRLG